MPDPASRSDEIRQFILSNVEQNPKEIASQTAKQFDISRQAASKHVRKLVDENLLEATGTTRNRTYSLKKEKCSKTYSLERPLDEDVVWRNDIRPLLGKLPKNVIDIWRYGFTEMLNNAIDHSEGKNVAITVEKDVKSVLIVIRDDGVGIFKKIQKALDLDDDRCAILELAKGKLTTAPARHSGEGIFFTSRSFDEFQIISMGEVFEHSSLWEYDVYFGKDSPRREEIDKLLSDLDASTTVTLKLSNSSTRILKDVFGQYTVETDGSWGFDKTIVPVQLALIGDDMLVSRSQAKRLLTRFERFKIIGLDFTGVEEIGQAFADEVFRVFRNEHPTIELKAINVNEQVRKMIARAENHY